jgi:TDG/mug DNA glycosylase family protein
MPTSPDPLDTLPDYLKPGLDIILVGLNPSNISVKQGHYFANPRNRFWPAFNQSGLVPVPVSSHQDHTLPDYGMGFTDVVKRPSSQAKGLTTQDFRDWAPVLKQKLLQCQPIIVCFHGLMAYTNYLQYAENSKARAVLGLQQTTIGHSNVFVVPNPSPANAQFSLDTLVEWYKQLKALRDRLKPSWTPPSGPS